MHHTLGAFPLIKYRVISTWVEIMKNRELALALYDHRYKLIDGERSDNNVYWKCVYCGSPADTRDHVPPITRVTDYESFFLEKEVYIKIPSCRWCNSRLRDTLQKDFLSRVDAIKDIMQKKWKKHLQESADWCDEEIKDMGFNLRTKILENSVKKQQYREKYEYYAGVDKVLEQLDV